MWLDLYCKIIRFCVRSRDHSNFAEFMLQFKSCSEHHDLTDFNWNCSAYMIYILPQLKLHSDLWIQNKSMSYKNMCLLHWSHTSVQAPSQTSLYNVFRDTDILKQSPLTTFPRFFKGAFSWWDEQLADAQLLHRAQVHPQVMRKWGCWPLAQWLNNPLSTQKAMSSNYVIRSIQTVDIVTDMIGDDQICNLLAVGLEVYTTKCQREDRCHVGRGGNHYLIQSDRRTVKWTVRDGYSVLLLVLRTVPAAFASMQFLYRQHCSSCNALV